ncbi:MAG: IstB-like protein ATP-binding protein [uncultured bacterium]|nr:MAG: IstB-like protein ATP-binding protein [uncultured bacterium]
MNEKQTSATDLILKQYLETLKLRYMQDNAASLATTAVNEKWSPMRFLKALIEGEFLDRQKRLIDRLIQGAKFPLHKTMSAFDWAWPQKINKAQIQHLFELHFVPENGNVIFLGTAGLGKTHMAIALGYHACTQGHSVLYASAMDIINTLSAAKEPGRLKYELKKYLTPKILIIDELGYLPIDQLGANLLFQVISQRYEKGCIILTTNKVFKQWPNTFNRDPVITTAVLDRLLHHAQTVVIQGKSYRMKDQIPNQ